MTALRNSLRLLCLFVSTAVTCVSAWSPSMSGGMKLGIDGEIYSFSTDLCPGGVFFKEPVHIPLTCTHGYFLKRANGCKMEGSQIVGGKNYACEPVNDDTSALTQAIIPVTNPDFPTHQTIAFYDDADSLKNFRRFTYVRGLEGYYSGSDSNASGIIVSNTQETPKTSIGSLCYEGKSHTHGAAYSAEINKIESKAPNKDLFTSKCEGSSYSFPWQTALRFPITQAYSPAEFFEGEIKAELSNLQEQTDKFGRLEIWNGLAYCLQVKVTQEEDGRVKPEGLAPTLEELSPLCTDRPAPRDENYVVIRQKRQLSGGRSYLRTKRMSTMVGPVIKCLNCCWDFYGKEGGKEGAGPAEMACCNQVGLHGK